MKKLTSILFGVILLSTSLFAQSNRYLDSYSGTLASSASVVVTIQQPPTDPNNRGPQISFEGVSTGYTPGVTVQCPGQSFTVAQAANGTAATATSAPIITMPGTTAQPQATFWTGSNVGGGITISPVWSYTSGSIAVLDWSPMHMGSGGNTINISLTVTNTGSGSCTVAIGIYHRESQ